MDIQARFAHVALLAEQYENFTDFAADGMRFLGGWEITPQQLDIALYMQNGPRLRMVMAQRGEAKTTLAALYAVWRIIHRPSTRVLIVSAGADNSSETATLIVRLIMQWDILECLRPDRQAGDRTSTEAFDVHFSLKGLDRSPSIACAGITSNLPGRRADLLIPDDIESNKNGLTVTMRQQIMQLSKEFSSICTHGDILYLGTPQSKDSVYNSLPGRGFDIRIWPGRYPTDDELPKYSGRLAPSILMALQENPVLQKGGGIDGSRGQPTDPWRYNDAALIEKELDKGPEDFALQYMLDTTLLDAQRQQLRLSDLVIANFSSDLLPEVVSWQASAALEVPLGPDFPVPMTKLYYAPVLQTSFAKPNDVFMFIDPAGGGVDEIGIAVGASMGPYIHLLDVAGLKGGLTPVNEKAICDICRELKVTRIKCESNMGAGVFEIHLRAIFASAVNENGVKDLEHLATAVSGEYSTGQKEIRIINSLVSAMQRHRVIVHQRVFDSDRKYGMQHSQEVRRQYSLWFQISNITTDRQSLLNDDRIEAVAGVVREFKHVLVQDAEAAARARQQAAQKEYLNNPMGYKNYKAPPQGTRGLLDSRASRRMRGH